MAANDDNVTLVKAKITIVQARNLFNADASHLRKNDVSDPYVKVSYQTAKYEHHMARKAPVVKVGKTKTIKDDLNPVWTEGNTFEVEVDLDTVFHFEVWDSDPLTRDDYLGEAPMELWEHVSENGHNESVWMQLRHDPGRKIKRDPQGSLKIKVCVQGLPAVVYEELQVIGAPKHEDVSGFAELMDRYLTENPEAKDRLAKIQEAAKTCSDRRSTLERKVSVEDTTTAASSASNSASSSSKPHPPLASRVSSRELPVELTSKAAAAGEEVRPWIRIPRVRTQLRRQESGVYCPKTTLVGASRTEIDLDIDHELPDGAELEVGKNPWATPTQPPKKGTYDWKNWGDTIYVKIHKAHHPKSLMELQGAIAKAKAAGKTLRCVGHAHSWSPIFTDNGNDILFTDKLVGLWKDLKSNDPADWRVTVLAGTKTGDLAALLKKNTLYLPTNVISELFIFGGLMSTGSHGSGWEEGLVLDYITSMQIVDSDGKLRKFDKVLEDGTDNPDWPYIVLNLGTYGVMYSLTLKVSPEIKRAKSIDYSINMKDFWDTDLHDNVIHNSHYVELFWFPFNEKMWVKLWDWTFDHVKWRPFHTMWHTFTQWLQSRIGHYINPLIASHKGHWPLPKDFWHDLTPDYLKLAYAMLEQQLLGTERNPKIQVEHVPDAIHWRKFLDAMPVWNTEFALNLPQLEGSDRADLSPAKDFWQYYCQLVEDIGSGKVKIEGSTNRYPCNVTLEARFGKNTCAALGNAYGNYHTCWIEWVTGVYTPGWVEFNNHIIKYLLEKYHDDKTPPRSHWAKGGQANYPGYVQVIQSQLGDRITKFNEVRDKYGVDPDNMFTTSWLRAIFGLKRPGEE